MPYEPTPPRLADAFGLTSDPAAYVPRLALESALAELAEGVAKKPACVALTGEAGLGKTLLLHVLRERLEGSFESLYVPFPHLAAPELWRWISVALGLGHGEDDRGAVLGRAVRLAAEGRGLVLLVDDAGALPSGARAELIAACGTRGFSLVMAFDSEDRGQLASLPAYVRRVELGPPMSLAETRAYVQARLRRVDPEGVLVAHLDLERLAALHDASGGVPAHLHALLDAWLRTPSAAPAAPSARGSDAALPATRGDDPIPGWLAELLRAPTLVTPRMRFALLAFLVLVTAGFWLFALGRGPGVPSVGVPVEQLAPPAEEPAVAAPPEAAPAPLEPPARREEPSEPPGSAEEDADTQVAGPAARLPS